MFLCKPQPNKKLIILILMKLNSKTLNIEMFKLVNYLDIIKLINRHNLYTLEIVLCKLKTFKDLMIVVGTNKDNLLNLIKMQKL